MQKNKTGLAILVGLLIVILFVVVGLMESNPRIEEVPAEQVTTEKGIAIKQIFTKQTFESNGVTYDFKEFTIENDTYVLKGCVSMPDERFWMPIVMLLNESTAEESVMGNFSNEKDPLNNDPAYRCHEIRFFDMDVNEGDEITIQVSHLEAYLDIMCADGKDLALLKTLVAEKFPDLEFELIVESGDGGGGGRFEITENPNSVLEEDFYTVFNEASTLTHPLNIEIMIEK